MTPADLEKIFAACKMRVKRILKRTASAYRGWLKQLVRYRQERHMWRAATGLILLGREMGEAQKDVDNAKDAIYRALDAMKRETLAVRSSELGVLLPCPFCGGGAESDTAQGFRRIKDGVMSASVAIYCTKCSAQIIACRDNFPQYEADDLLTILTEAWNVRTPTTNIK